MRKTPPNLPPSKTAGTKIDPSASRLRVRSSRMLRVQNFNSTPKTKYAVAQDLMETAKKEAYDAWFRYYQALEMIIAEHDDVSLQTSFAIHTQERLVKVNTLLFKTDWTHANSQDWLQAPPNDLPSPGWDTDMETCVDCKKLMREINGEIHPGDGDWEFRCVPCLKKWTKKQEQKPEEEVDDCDSDDEPVHTCETCRKKGLTFHQGKVICTGFFCNPCARKV
jgi:hypothetical protein